MEGIYSVRRDAAHLRSAERNYCDGEWAIVPDNYKYSISTDWEAPWRTDRIYRVLESGKKFSSADMLALQMDVSSTFDRFCADKFVYALDHAPKLSDRAKRAADILRDWDGRMSADSAGADD